MNLSRRDLLRLAAVVSGRSVLSTGAVVGLATEIGCRLKSIGTTPTPPNTVRTLRAFLRGRVVELETRFPEVSIIATETIETSAVRDHLGYRTDRVVTKECVIRFFDGQRWFVHGLDSFDEVSIGKQIDAMSAEASHFQVGMQGKSTGDATPENYQRRGQIDIASVDNEHWLQRVAVLFDRIAKIGSSRTIYRSCVATGVDETRLFIGGGRDVRQSVGRIRVDGLLISRVAESAISAHVSHCGSGGFELLELDDEALATQATESLIQPVGLLPTQGELTKNVVLAPAVAAVMIGVGLAPYLRAERWRTSTSVWAQRDGERMGVSSLFSLTDDPRLLGGYASYDVDSEGGSSSRVSLISNGVLGDPLSSRANLTTEGNTNGHAFLNKNLLIESQISNLIIHSGQLSSPTLATAMGDGYLVDGVEVIAGDRASGRLFLQLRQAREVRGGTITGRVYGPVRLTANIKELLRNIRGLSSETTTFPFFDGDHRSSITCPHILTRAKLH